MASGFSFSIKSSVTSVFSRISAPHLPVSLISQSRYSRISVLNGTRQASFNKPPSLSDFSYSLTLWPLCTSVWAAIMPAGPPPITMTSFRSFFDTGWICPLTPQRGLMAQLILVPHVLALPQRSHRVHGRISACWALRDFLTISPSAIKLLAMATISALPDAIISSACSKVVIIPTTATGTCRCFFTSAA